MFIWYHCSIQQQSPAAAASAGGRGALRATGVMFNQSLEQVMLIQGLANDREED